MNTDPFALSILLEPRGHTFENVRQNPRAAVIVSSGSPFEPFLQGSVDATIVDDQADIQTTADAMLAKSPQIAPFLGGPMVAIRFAVTSWRATDVNRGWLPGRELVPR